MKEKEKLLQNLAKKKMTNNKDKLKREELKWIFLIKIIKINNIKRFKKTN